MTRKSLHHCRSPGATPRSGALLPRTLGEIRGVPAPSPSLQAGLVMWKEKRCKDGREDSIFHGHQGKAKPKGPQRQAERVCGSIKPAG